MTKVRTKPPTVNPPSQAEMLEQLDDLMADRDAKIDALRDLILAGELFVGVEVSEC